MFVFPSSSSHFTSLGIRALGATLYSIRVIKQQGGAQLTKLVYNSNNYISRYMVYGRYIYTYYGLYTNKHHWGGTTLRWVPIGFFPSRFRHGATGAFHLK